VTTIRDNPCGAFLLIQVQRVRNHKSLLCRERALSSDKRRKTIAAHCVPLKFRRRLSLTDYCTALIKSPRAQGSRAPVCRAEIKRREDSRCLRAANWTTPLRFWRAASEGWRWSRDKLACGGRWKAYERSRWCGTTAAVIWQWVGNLWSCFVCLCSRRLLLLRFARCSNCLGNFLCLLNPWLTRHCTCSAPQAGPCSEAVFSWKHPD